MGCDRQKNGFLGPNLCLRFTTHFVVKRKRIII